ncbi:hypothetical protein ACELLULO517_25640 [Acidisoma cellulosilytica]|uniref:Uncharacterized protein n=1 Tax=Acidisoma cellulosilyticum TaxID=2802395 RepID=A0A963Z887_9PROT|nr:hypothetical protein [Acidisoma cellulosilyticum]MCB8883658.1 hypothetical protein [Acidisoma cellulosilyticum]
MIANTNNGSAILIWVERGQTPTETAFRMGSPSSTPTYHLDIQTAVNEAMRILSSGLSLGREPWILSQGHLLGPDDIQLAHGRMPPHLSAMMHY